MNKVYLVSFATEDFEKYQLDLINSAKKYGYNDGFHYTTVDLKRTEFYNAYIDIFKEPRGFGYWLWKPFFILETLNKIRENDILFYVDSGSLFINNPDTLIDIAKNDKHGIVSFDCWPLQNYQWTKRDAFINMDLDTEKYWYEKHVIATVILFRKNNFTINFVKEWLEACTNKHTLTETQNIQGKDIEGYIKHMGDQPVFSLLIAKYQIETYRNPSKWGNFLKMPGCREEGEYVGYPYAVSNSISGYSTNSYSNSPYRTIFEFNRKQNSTNNRNLLISKLKSLVKGIFKL
jgi:hypothetical protein